LRPSYLDLIQNWHTLRREVVMAMERDRIIEARMRADRVPGLSVALVSDGRLRWAAGFGQADLATGRAATPETAYLWFSMTKIATATAVVRLADQGRLDLDAPVGDYLPAFDVVQQPRLVTVRHVLSHTSGLANPVPIRWVHPAGAPPPDRRAFVEGLLGKHRRLRSMPGVLAQYSNLGYLVLGEVVAEVAAMPYEEYVRREILEPLGMRHSGFGAIGGPEPVATGYQRLARGLTPLLRAALPRGIVAGRQRGFVAYHPFRVTGSAYGGLVGPVVDAARLVALHLGDGEVDGVRLLSPDAAIEMRRLDGHGDRLDVGLGWYRPRGASDFVEHLGGGSGYFTAMRLYPERGLGVVTMGNATRYHHDEIIAAIVR
jgi:CubicO group peptidase (beta-lactamase class C family)